MWLTDYDINQAEGAEPRSLATLLAEKKLAKRCARSFIPLSQDSSLLAFDLLEFITAIWVLGLAERYVLPAAGQHSLMSDATSDHP